MGVTSYFSMYYIGRPSLPAAAFGDPHMRTFDGAVYTFNGQGEFLLMHAGPASVRGVSVGLVLQARLQQPRPLSCEFLCLQKLSPVNIDS